MFGTDVISRREHEMEVSRLAGTIERLNAELSALAAYLVTTGPARGRGDKDRAVSLAARMGCITKHEAEERIRRIDDAISLSANA
ncbi:MULTISPECIES: hypothetical protein [Lichenihabitans]|uniref:hypothetical protein n=1 Tax=Lichenihabitans TaxID=2723776 RepID=UPI00103592BE|nr:MULTISPECIES: hypothetical protein [Lichenihabitans]UDL93823.1 hypothetical protein LGH83_14825 [Lichenihabitans sp. PAMC28606]